MHVVIVANDFPAEPIIQSQTGSKSPAVLYEETGRHLRLIQVVLAERFVLLGGKIQWAARADAGDSSHQRRIQRFRISQGRGAGAAQGRREYGCHRILAIDAERITWVSAGAVPIVILLAPPHAAHRQGMRTLLPKDAV